MKKTNVIFIIDNNKQEKEEIYEIAEKEYDEVYFRAIQNYIENDNKKI